MKWTDEQREAIEYRNSNILLAAAAGSGKTAVLVQRIIELIQKDGVSVNELLVLTFTEAAAGEMREKIKKAILKALKENPENQHLQRQRLLMHASSISTVHSFCLNTLKCNIHLTDIPVDFSIVSELENTIILKEALDEILERFYARIDKDKSFENLVMGYGGIKNDTTLREIILGLHGFSRSMAYPVSWLNETVRNYRETAKTGKLCGKWWKNQLKELVEQSRDEILKIYEQITYEIENSLDKDHPYVAFFADEVADIERLFAHIDADSYSSVKEAVDSFEFGRLNGKRKPEERVFRAQEKIKNLRSVAKDIISDLCDCFVVDETTVVERIAKTYPAVRTLKNMVLMVERRYARKKRAKSFLDFNDLEHEMLKLLVDKKGEPTEVALKLREKYEAILVDEYQDTNNIQDEIFRTVSRENKNVFMVGDLKQSIYKFRNAVPKLFSDKYHLYGRDKREGHLIRLFKNFRSRQSVVDTVNFVFSSIMSPQVGDVDYTEEEYLVQGADYPDIADMTSFDTEFHMICKDLHDENGNALQQEVDKYVLEARVAASRITEMINGGMLVFDKELGTTRPVEFRDVVVLMRKTKDIASVFEKTFEENGIPVYTEVGHSYLGTLEIQTVMAFLQVIDNPCQDIPLIAVMRSPIWGFEPSELAVMRKAHKGGYFFDAVKAAAENGDAKAKAFLEDLEKLRTESENIGVDKLIFRIYYEYGYYAYVGSLTHGAERQANLRVLLERATEFEHTKMSGLFSFMNYIETMRSEEKDMTPAKVFGEGENVVRIMSIHKSKGLEFPVVFLVNTANEFNLRDASKNVIWDEQGGLGMEFVDLDMRIKYASLPKTLVGLKLKNDMISEEMRLLYVALTRAREKLIITATFKENEKKWKNPVWDKDGHVPEAHARKLHNYKEWLTSAFMLHPDAKSLREYCEIFENVPKTKVDFGLKVFLYEGAEKVSDAVQTFERKTLIEEDVAQEVFDEIKEHLEFEYPNKALCSLPVKMSVSEVKRMQAEEADFVPLLEPLRTYDLMNLEPISGAERGTVVHFVMQMIDPDEISCTDDVRKIVERLQNEKIISSAQADAVNCEKVAKFFLSDLGKRLKSAVRRETEFSFYTQESADEIFGNGLDEKILLQGTIDCFFVEKDGKVVLLDYKTDRAATPQDAERVAEKYKIQMKYYRRALKEILQKDVDECYLYFLDCGVAVPIK